MEDENAKPVPAGSSRNGAISSQDSGDIPGRAETKKPLRTALKRR